MSFQSKNTTNNTSIIDWLIYAFFVGEETLSPSTATIASWFQHHTYKPLVSSVTMFLRKFSLPSSSWLISTRFSFWSSVNKHSMNFALTRCIWSFSVKIWWQDPVLMSTSSATSRTVKRRFSRITAQTVSTWSLFVNPLKPTGHVMHHQFNIQQLYALPTLYLCVLYLFENKQRLVPLTA